MIKNSVLAEKRTMRGYVAGYALSILLTLEAYGAVRHNALSHSWLVALIATLAITQFLVQMIFFLHLGKETKPRWKLFVFLFMVLIVMILVFGSLWIMSNLNYRMTPDQMNSYLRSQDGL